MGLDSVELVMAFEERFEIAIPDEAAGEMITPRNTIDYLESRLEIVPATRCLTQHTFYRLRHGLRTVHGEDRGVRPATKVREVLNKWEWPRVLEAAGEFNWPEHIPWKNWILDGPETVCDLTLYLAMQPAESDESWTGERVELAVRWVIWDRIRAQGFSLDDQYVRDLGVD